MPFRVACQSKSWVLRSGPTRSRFVQNTRPYGALAICRGRTRPQRHAAGGADSLRRVATGSAKDGDISAGVPTMPCMLSKTPFSLQIDFETLRGPILWPLIGTGISFEGCGCVAHIDDLAKIAEQKGCY